MFSNKKQTNKNPQEQRETEKGFGEKKFVNPKDTKDTSKNTRQFDSKLKIPNQEANFAQTNSLRIFFYFKEFLTDWLTELSVRPTQMSIILTVTLYLIAISSTVQRRDGDRWLKSLLNAKLPGYTTLYQDTSWETFRSYTLKCLLEKKNLHQSSSFRKDGAEDFKGHAFKQTNQSSFNTQKLKGYAPINETELHSTTLREQAMPVKDVENFQFLNSPLGRGDALGFEKKRFVDLYKDKALIHLRSPWEKEIRKDFVGFFVKRQLKSATQTTSNTSQSGNSIVLPWFRIDACNRPDRVVLATPKASDQLGGESTDFRIAPDTRLQPNKRKYLRDRREQSVLCLREDPKRFALAQRANNTNATDFKTPSAVPSHSIKERIFGLEYINPFQTSKGRVYAQNDSIPLKMESAYSLPDLFTRNSISSGVTEEKASLLEASLLASTQSKLRDVYTNASFTKNNQLFFGKNFYCFQKRLRELFYWYGLFPPYNLMELMDQKLSHPQGDKPNLINEAHRDTFKDNSNLDHTERSTKDRFVKNLSPQIEEETGALSAGNSLQEGVYTDTEIQDVFRNQGKKELSCDNLTKFVSRELEQGLNVSSDTILLNSDYDKNAAQDAIASTPQLDRSGAYSGFAKLFSKENISQPPQSDVYEANKKHTVNALSHPNRRLYSGIKQQIDNLIDEFANQSDNLTDPDQLTFFSAPSSTVNSIAVKEIGSKKEELQQTLAQFAFKNWPLLANVNSYALQGQSKQQNSEAGVENRFEKSDALLTRLMSGYKFPDCTKNEINRLFKEYVFPRLLVAGSVSFSPSYLINQTLLRPLYIKLPPALPFSFFENLALSLNPISSPSTHRKWETLPDIVAKDQTPKHSNINIEYKRISLQELTEVKDLFVKLGKDYEEYSSLPKDSAPAIRISPSLEDDKALKLKAEQKEKRDEERVTPFERLQKIREREERFELGKRLAVFAYKNQFAFHTGKIPFLENSIYKNPEVFSESSYLFPAQAVETPAFTKQENSWISFRLGEQNLLSDRKYSFFGRKHLQTKRLIAHEQKEIDEQISKGSYRAPGIKFLGQGDSTLTENNNFDKLTGEQARRLFSHKTLQKRARKGLIKLLGSPDLSAHHVTGSLNRTRKANRALRGKVIKSAYSHLRWQKKRFRSNMLGTPCNRHLVMPEITSTDWKKMLEWQLKNYFFLEEKRLEPLIKEDPEKNFKIKQLHIYLPWVTIRTPSNSPFQWPYTRLDYANCTIPARISENQFYELPEYKPVYYWDSGKSVSLSLPASKFSTGGLQKLDHNRNAGPLLPLPRVKGGLAGNSKMSGSSGRYSNGIRTRTVEEPFLCEPVNNQSWLLIYRLFLAFALQHLLKYVYRVSLKRFIIEMANSDFGLRVTSPKFREWLEHARPKPFYTPKKRLRDVAAIEESIPILSEIVWYLRNFGRGRTASRGFLLVGPAGAEKTSVVQAIAGECRLPVVVQSISALALTNDDPYEQLENAFTLARQQAPCVLFLDDLDFVGQSRAGVIKNDIGPADLLFSLDTYTAEGKLCLANLSNSLHTNLLPKGNRDGERHLDWQFNPLAANPVAHANIELGFEQNQASGSVARGQGGGALATGQHNQESQTRRLNLLLRLLTEMDGVAPLNGVVILATSEQPALLDPALLRAGRFERRIHLSLPNKERRIQLFKAGTKKIGGMQSIPWDYLGLRTTNMSGADIASAINHSAIRAILDNTVHTVESLEHGLNCVNGLPNTTLTAPVLQRSDPFHYSRLAFYQAGKAVVHNLLLDHPELGFCSLNDASINQDHIPGTDEITRESLQVLVSDEKAPTTVSTQPSVDAFSGGDSPTAVAERSEIPVTGYAGSKNSPPGSRYRPPLKKSRQDIFMRSNLTSTVQSHKSGTTFSARTRIQFETRLVGLYAGKAAELLHLSGNVVSRTQFGENKTQVREGKLQRYQRSVGLSTSAGEAFSGALRQTSDRESVSLESCLALNVERLADLSRGKGGLVSRYFKSSKTSGWLWQSNLGFSELLTASSLIHLMVDRWYLYSQKIFTYKINKVMPSLNHEQIQNETLFPLAKRLSQELEFDLIKPNFWGLTSYTSHKALPMQAHTQENSTDELYLNKQIYQERGRTDWWQAKVCQALEMTERPYGKWYRIYLPKLEEREQNKEWVPPDTIFHQPLTLSNLATKGFKEKSKLATESDRRLRSKASQKRVAGPEKGAVVEKSLTQPNLLRRPSWLRKRSIGNSNSSNLLIRRQGSLKRYPFPLRGDAQLKNTSGLNFTGDNLQSIQHGRGVTHKASFKQMSSSNSARSLRFMRLHLNCSNQGIPSLKTLNDLYLFERDSTHQKAVMNCFYTAFSLLNENRELLDSFADHLIRFKILRSHEIAKMCSLFYPFPK
uniref:cell division protein n=1 Tax=Phyllosiphon coccidium TaxID=1837062 RepID=UPI0024112BD8|nr:cell division protein [Phyllosiphon coccidium]WDY12711.1 cell division protein [Phyllosiphon coccidium]